MDDGFFSSLENNKPYIKAAFQGFAGSGKSYTMTKAAIALYKLIGSTKPVVLFDTEKAGKFLRPLFDAAGVPILYKESRSMADLAEVMKRCRAGVADVLLIDSITHVWEDFLAAYMRKVGRQRMEIHDWGVVKPAWKRQFSEPMVQDPYHVFFTGRAGYEYETVEDDRGKKQMVKAGVKMKADGEVAYEPDFLVLMERYEEVIDKDNKAVYREATFLKDRSDLLDGKTLRNPSGDDFLPSFQVALKDPRPASPVEGDASKLFRTEEDIIAARRRKEVLLGEIEGTLTQKWPGQSAEAKAAKVNALEHGFGVKGWAAVQAMTVAQLEAGYQTLTAYVNGQPAAAA